MTIYKTPEHTKVNKANEKKKSPPKENKDVNLKKVVRKLRYEDNGVMTTPPPAATPERCSSVRRCRHPRRLSIPFPKIAF